MSRVMECEICRRKALDLGKPWNLKGWTVLTTIGPDCELIEHRVCPDHPEWSVSGSPYNKAIQ